MTENLTLEQEKDGLGLQERCELRCCISIFRLACFDKYIPRLPNLDQAEDVL